MLGRQGGRVWQSRWVGGLVGVRAAEGRGLRALGPVGSADVKFEILGDASATFQFFLILSLLLGSQRFEVRRPVVPVGWVTGWLTVGA